jgi:asparagine synthase (glutamine-hydrolysing)
LTRLICDTYLRGNGIVQGDRLSMASSVEMRLPLLDYRLVETVVGLRKAHSDRGLPPKYHLKKALGDVLPEWVLNRPKRGFTPPVRAWHAMLFARHGQDLKDGVLVQSGVLSGGGGEELSRGYFHEDATFPVSYKALVLETWCRKMMSVENGVSS